MKIKDVERLTGLTQKSIRLYESKGLLTVERQDGNEYRSFSEENINQLRFIRLLRYLDFSLSEIKELMQAETETVQAALREKLIGYDKAREETERREKICRALIKDVSKEHRGEVAAEYLELVDKFDDEEFLQAERGMKDAMHHSLGGTLILTVMFLGPILNLWMACHDEEWSRVPMCAVFALGAAVLLTLNWVFYLYSWGKDREYQKQRNKGSLWGIVVVVLVIAVMIGIFFLIQKVQEWVLLPESWLFYDMNGVGELLLILLVELPMIMGAFALLSKWTGNPDYEDGMLFVTLVKRFWKVLLPLWAAALYSVFISITVVTPDAIIQHSPLHPVGVRYGYEDVERIEMGYRRRSGDFYYKIYMGKAKATFSAPTDNEKARREYAEDSYLELEEFDRALRVYGAERSADDTYEERARYDSYYIERFRRIMEG